MKVAPRARLAFLALLPGGDSVLSLDVLQRVVVRTDVVWTAKHLTDDGAVLRQGHKAVPEGHHPDDRGVGVLDKQQVSWQRNKQQPVSLCVVCAVY